MKARNITRTVAGKRAVDGAGVRLVRVLGHADVQDSDPFLMLDAFDSTNPSDYIRGFPLHPHRGIETFTYLIDGEIAHRDTLGSGGVIRGGQAQWMNAGSGIQHEEMPRPTERLWGLQLWINLPRAHKMTAPTYRDLRREDMPTVTENGVTVRVAAGTYGALEGPQGAFVQPLILDVTLAPGAAFTLSVPEGDTLIVYTLEGKCGFGEPSRALDERVAAFFGPGEGLAARAGDTGARFMVLSGAPLKEPVAWGGPVVMNTREELDRAFRELDEGTFVKG